MRSRKGAAMTNLDLDSSICTSTPNRLNPSHPSHPSPTNGTRKQRVLARRRSTFFATDPNPCGGFHLHDFRLEGRKETAKVIDPRHKEGDEICG